MAELLENLYMHVQSLDDIKENVQKKDEESFVARTAEKTEKNKLFEEGFNFKQIKYEGSEGSEANYGYMQTMILVAAYIAGVNKESTDLKMFDPKVRTKKQQNRQAKHKAISNMKGKTKKFSLERLTAVLDYLLRLEIVDSNEYMADSCGHSLDYYATINTLCADGVLKRQVPKRGVEQGETASREDFTATAYKCNFTESNVVEAAAKFKFNVLEYVNDEDREE